METFIQTFPLLLSKAIRNRTPNHLQIKIWQLFEIIGQHVDPTWFDQDKRYITLIM